MRSPTRDLRATEARIGSLSPDIRQPGRLCAGLEGGRSCPVNKLNARARRFNTVLGGAVLVRTSFVDSETMYHAEARRRGERRGRRRDFPRLLSQPISRFIIIQNRTTDTVRRFRRATLRAPCVSAPPREPSVENARSYRSETGSRSSISLNSAAPGLKS